MLITQIYIFILNLTPGFIELGKDNCKTRRATFKLGELVCLILDILQYTRFGHALFSYGYTISSCQHMVQLSISFRVTSLALGQSYDCPSASEVMLKDLDKTDYCQTSNIRHTLIGNKLVDHSDVVGASPVSALQLHLHSRLNACLQNIAQRQLQDETRNI